MSTPSPLVAHADWSVSAKKRWMTVATPAGSTCQVRAEPVGPIETLITRLQQEASDRHVLLGVDAPIGLPIEYARLHAGDHTDFPSFLRGLTHESAFFSVCDDIGEVTGARPFFPRTTHRSPRRQAHALRLGVAHHDALLRQCDRKTAERAGAACLFWTLGPNQVGKAALSLWREMLLPAIQSPEPPALWPFDGALAALLRSRPVTVAETYPAEALSRLKPRWRGSKRRQADRVALADDIGAWMERLHAKPDPALAADIADGFGTRPEGEDRFDSLLGLLGMLAVLHEPGSGEAPEDEAILWEGWILGQRSDKV